VTDMTLPKVPHVNFACRGARTARIAYVAAFVLARAGIQSFLATEDNNVRALDAEVWNTPIGTYRCIIVGQETFNLLPAHSQQAALFPPNPAVSDYWSAVGVSPLDDIARMAEVLNYITEPAASGTAGNLFAERWAAITGAQ
jgi:hypothetical protein